MARKDRENLEQLMASNPKLQEQLEERVAAAVAEARAAWEAEQEAPEEEVAEPSEPEEARRLAEEREALEEEKAAFARQRMEVAVGQELCKRNLPAAFAPWLAGETAEESAQRLDTFEVLFQEAISSGGDQSDAWFRCAQGAGDGQGLQLAGAAQHDPSGDQRQLDGDSEGVGIWRLRGRWKINLHTKGRNQDGI